MNQATQEALIATTKNFYNTYAESFSNTRTHAWTGWSRLIDLCELGEKNQLCVLDVAAGNCRFAAYLADAFPQADISVYAVDVTSDLLSHAQDVMDTHAHVHIHPLTLDILHEDIRKRLPHDVQFDLVVSFGFMHHIPSYQRRLELLDVLLNVADGAPLGISFWNFMNDERIAKKAAALTHDTQVLNQLGIAYADLEAGDYLLGWKEQIWPPRYCHNFDEREVQDIAAWAQKRKKNAVHFYADGKHQNLNQYLVLTDNQDPRS